MKQVDISLKVLYEELSNRIIAENPFENLLEEQALDELQKVITKGDESVEAVDRALGMLCKFQNAARYNAFVVGYKTAIALLAS